MEHASFCKYSAKLYDFPPDFLRDISQLRSSVTYRHIFYIWLSVFVLSLAGRELFLTTRFFWFAYPLLSLLIASRQGALLQIVHEGSHRLISSSKRANSLVGEWFAALPVGLTLSGYTRGHMQHHAGTNTVDDLPTDLEKYSAVHLNDRRLYLLFLFDLLGITALRSFIGHNFKALLGGRDRKTNAGGEPGKLLKLAVCQLVVILVIFQLDWKLYFVLWALPLITTNMVLLRIRGIAEHGSPNQFQITVETADQGNFYTRSVPLDHPTFFGKLMNSIERTLIGSLACNFHHEHHLLPKIPFYNLHKVHALAGTSVKKNGNHVYLSSYFGALFRKVPR